MAKEIIGSVRIGNTVYKAGQEEELAAVADAAQIKRLTDKGVIAGFGKSKSPTEGVVPAGVVDDADIIENGPSSKKATAKTKEK